ncbi:MAG: WYL domain-containing protein [Burkholderiales bacterium]|nr:WYL domain-containing protein [Burkholderiales bacterium]
MAKRPDTRETVLLALELLKRIPRARKVSARELHEQLPADLARDLRTVQRQLDMLAQTFDIERDDTSKPYGYRWKERGVGLSLPSLSEQESLLLALAEEHLRHLLPASLMKSMAGFFAQAHRKLNGPEGAGREREWMGKVRVVSQTQPLLAPKVLPGVFDAVSQALYTNHWLNLDYRNAEGRRSCINVMPLGLAQQGPRLYLVCRYEGFGNERSLALHRIVKAEVSAAEFRRPADFRLDRYDDDGRFGFGEGKKIRLVFRIETEAGRHLLETPLSADQQVEEVSGHLEISATVVESAQLKWWLRGFGSAIDIREPSKLANECTTEAPATLAHGTT